MQKHLLFFFVVFLIHPLHTLGQDTLTSSFYFESASAEISEIDKNNFQLQFGKLTVFELKSLEIYGYCDDLGSEEKNLELSNKRAQVVKTLMNSFVQISEDKELVSGKGEVDINRNSLLNLKEQRAQNRRVDVRLIYHKEVPIQKEEQAKTQVLEPQLDNKLKVGDKVTLRNILFIGGRDLLLPESYESLDELIFFMKKYPEYSITILGHVCCQNDGQDGMDNDTQIRNLSLVRAKRIYDILVEKGISKNRLDYKGMKGNYPTGLGEEADRRVEIEISAIHP